MTQGFYTAVALEFQQVSNTRDSVSLWRATAPSSHEAPPTMPEEGDGGEGLSSPSSPSVRRVGRCYLQVGAEGLFPRPILATDPQREEVCGRMRLLGRLIGKVCILLLI